jgi:curved DNA-binding protein CbpA
MAQLTFSADWQAFLTDPYAILGVSVVADEKRILKHYRNIAKILHPDRYVQADPQQREFVGQVLAHLVNPAYAQLKQETNRAEVIALLRMQVQHMTQQGTLVPQTESARQLARQSVQSADIFYEQQVAEIAAQQYSDLSGFATRIEALRELNQVFLQLKMGGGNLREQRSGLMPPTAAATAQPTTAQPTTAHHTTAHPATQPTTPEEETQAEQYDRRHHDRAAEYLQKGAFDQAIQELRDAIRMRPMQSDYHALLSYAYLKRELIGMAKVHCRQALKLNPEDQVAQKVAKRLKLELDNATTVTPAAAQLEKRGLFSRFRR